MEDVVPQLNRDLSRFKQMRSDSNTLQDFNQIRPKSPQPASRQQRLNIKDTSNNGNSNNSSSSRPALSKESRSFVKYTSGSSNFEDLKLKAKNSWDVGVDLRLKEDVKKPKKQWITEDDFFKSTAIMIPEPPSTTSRYPSLGPDNKTYAEVTDPNKPAWAETADHNIPAWADTSIQPEAPVDWWTPQAVNVTDPPPIKIETVKPLNWDHPDREKLLLIYQAIRDTKNESLDYIRDNCQSWINNLPNTPLRIVGYVFRALTMLLEFDCANGQFDSLNVITSQIQCVFSAMDNYIQNYACTPNDHSNILKFSMSLCKHSEMNSRDIPLQELLARCKTLIKRCSNDDYVNFAISLHALTGDSWNELVIDEDAIPSLPDAKDFMQGILLGSSAPEEDISNVIQGSWPELDLRNYLYTHYMLRRQDLMGPVQDALSCLLNSGSPQEVQDDTIICHKTKPIGTLPHVSSFNLAVVFSLRYCSESDEMIRDDIEGSFIYLVPEYDYSTMTKEKKVEVAAKGAIIGHALQPINTIHHGQCNRLLPVCLDNGEVSRLDWSKTYTMITVHNNAPTTLATLRWLELEYTDFNMDHFSTAITPRVLAAKNDVPMSELAMLNEYSAEDANAIPSYLRDIELDISSIMINKYAHTKAKPDRNIWPTLPGQWNTASPPCRPSPYEISPSQLRAIQHALTHRVAVISGAPGTGKTFVAGKLALLMSQALEVGQFRQPLLVISKSQPTLDRILKSVAHKIQNTVRFGYDSDEQQFKQATQLARPGVTDQDHRLFNRLERRLTYIQSKLDLLCKKRAKTEAKWASQLAPAVPPEFMGRLQEGYQQRYGKAGSPEEAWSAWFSAKGSEIIHDLTDLLAKQTAGKGVLPMINAEFFAERNQWLANNPSRSVSITDAIHWPFETSDRTGAGLRQDLLKCWQPGNLWDLSPEQRTEIANQIVRVLLEYIDYDIQKLMNEHAQEAQTLDNMMIKQWTYLVRFNRVIGITADFAAAHQSWLSHVWPRCVIVDEASEILESTLAPSIFGPRVEHLILLGNIEVSSIPTVSRHFKRELHNMSISLFERWKKNSPSEVLRLEEQWRIHSDVASILDTFNSSKDEESLLLITAPLMTCNENMRDNKKTTLYGLNHRMFFIDYQASRSLSNTHLEYKHLSSAAITQAEVDEAQFLAHLAVYICQQPNAASARVAILTVCDLQKKLIQELLKTVIPQRTTFKKSLEKLTVSRIDEQKGCEFWFTIISTGTPGQSQSVQDNLSVALSRAKYGVYIVSKPGKDRVNSRWNKFGLYMREKNLCGRQISLTCYNHGDTLSVGFWTDFERVKNGGCTQPCKALMTDGHVCPEECHHGGHDEIVCREQCNRARPCSHPCLNKCFVCFQQATCPPCQEVCTINLRCGHPHTMICSEVPNQDKIKCLVPVDITLPCGHPAHMQNAELMFSALKYATRHTNVVYIYVKNCVEHPISMAAVIALIIALKNSSVVIVVPMDVPIQTIILKDVLKNMCDRPPCNAPCREIFNCSHQCPGLCGEPCPPCAQCNPELKCSISLRTLSEFDLNEYVYMLPECGCIFSVESLDSYFTHQVTSGEHAAIKLWECPHCKKNIYTAGRYGNYIKTEVGLVNKIKARLEEKRRELTDNERQQIVNAMNQEVQDTGIHSIVGGRWFVCPNEHPYHIGDCGGATEVSKCPDCSAPIGGTQHRVIESNRFYGEFDGSKEPAWPGQPN
ncbi:hypothetical protein G6F56_000498 [Rhizopus delemar]|nr:hypothetical protein G6F56_000498 [Rhizopus delemar]